MNIFQRVIRKTQRTLRKAMRQQDARRKGILYVPPNFIYQPWLNSDSLVIDAGCSYEADFSLFMIERYGVKAYGVDPTRKHKPALETLEESHKDHFFYLPLAICAQNGSLIFHESRIHESGSIFNDHTNMLRDETISYEVEAVTPATLLERIGVEKIDLLKLDLEGAEFDLLAQVQKEDLLPFRQIFVEFHHHAIRHFSENRHKTSGGTDQGFWI